MDYKLIAWVLGALILLVLIIFYFAYSKYARQKIARHAVNGLERLLKRTRLILIILVLALAGDLGYGHFSPQNSAIHMNLFARTSKVFSSVKNKVFDKSAESSSMDLKKKESSEKASSKKASSEKRSNLKKTRSRLLRVITKNKELKQTSKNMNLLRLRSAVILRIKYMKSGLVRPKMAS
ncbi:hypothetical protein N6G94_08940 [Pediococcus inopinatus]|uniref:hypothetical protein n=1 Tax=Pediococcus inopinatus TaxID=114090 RepID=UPI002B261E59|nr:hypothetical protein [Pediococcus inopinatus]WPC17295.1 hypothetical protein N6G94_08940 [Pediococcus inopinatus]